MLRPRLVDARLKGRLGRLLFAIATIAQVVGVLAGPMDHWRANSKIGAHIDRGAFHERRYEAVPRAGPTGSRVS